jgi:hypothetical protein
MRYELGFYIPEDGILRDQFRRYTGHNKLRRRIGIIIFTPLKFVVDYYVTLLHHVLVYIPLLDTAASAGSGGNLSQ